MWPLCLCTKMGWGVMPCVCTTAIGVQKESKMLGVLKIKDDKRCTVDINSHEFKESACYNNYIIIC